jgi:UDP-N-acetylglucosamine diphosphorylase/glucosamine-1-phosphate N-acetyltransferase
MKIVLFEDEGFIDLLPLVYFRPVWELRCGITLLSEKIKNAYQDLDLRFIARQYLMDHYLEPEKVFNFSSDKGLLYINGRTLLKATDKEKLDALGEKCSYVCNNEIVAFRTDGKNMQKYFRAGVLDSKLIFNDFEQKVVDFELLKYPWDLIDRNGEEILRDFAALKPAKEHRQEFGTAAHILAPDNIYLSESARVMPGAVLNAEDGPIWIGKNTRVMPNAVLEGPLAIGNNCQIKIGAKIYENTSIGPVCKIGGEIEESIFQGHSNKQHDGFLGHSYLGSWINLGADTNNSDLKNNYGEITVLLNGKAVHTGKQFLGLMMGDHSKTAINTMFNTGTVVGVNCNIFGAGFTPKFLPSYSWGGSEKLTDYNFDKAIEVAKIVMTRRNVTFTENHYELFKAVRDLAFQLENRDQVS